jgi:hypothetical protein
MENEELKKQLFSSEDKFGDNYYSYLLEEYKMYISMADKTSERRGLANNFFVTINSSFITVMTILSNVQAFPIKYNNGVIIISSLFGVVLCIIWYNILMNYSNLNEARFFIIHLIEEKLPVKLFKSEWDYIEKHQKKDTKYNPLTYGEKNIPFLFIGLYIVLMAYNFLIIMG